MSFFSFFPESLWVPKVHRHSTLLQFGFPGYLLGVPLGASLGKGREGRSPTSSSAQFCAAVSTKVSAEPSEALKPQPTPSETAETLRAFQSCPELGLGG